MRSSVWGELFGLLAGHEEPSVAAGPGVCLEHVKVNRESIQVLGKNW